MSNKPKPNAWDRLGDAMDYVMEDVLWFGGAIVVSVGIAMIYLPAAFIFLGAACMILVAKKVTRWL